MGQRRSKTKRRQGVTILSPFKVSCIDAKTILANTEYGIRNTEYGIRNTEYGILRGCALYVKFFFVPLIFCNHIRIVIWIALAVKEKASRPKNASRRAGSVLV